MFDAVGHHRPSVVLLGLLLLAGLFGGPAEAAAEDELKVHARVLRHRATSDAVELVRPLLSAEGTVAEQGTTIVVRDRPEIVARALEILAAFDHAPGEVELEIHVVRAGPTRAVISPPDPPRPLPEEMIGKFRGLLRYEDYEVIASAKLTSREGENVEWDLGDEYDVRFKLGALMSERRLRLEGFRVLEEPPRTAEKGRTLPPEELFRGTLNLWVDRPFTLVIADSAEAPEALLVAITCRPREGGE